MAEKQLIVVVEGTMAMQPYWPTVFCDYVEKIIRSLPGNELSGCGQKPSSTSTVEMSLITFNTHGSGCLVQRSGWTRDIELFLQWLSALPLNGGGFSDAAIAEGLSEALMMFLTIQNGSQNQQNVDFQKHCILVAASDPCPLPTPGYRPQMQNMEQSEISDAQTESCLYDAEAVAKSFAQCFVSLSIICPKQLPKLRAIYNAGKRNPRAADPPIDNVKTPHFLVLISENFIEAQATLSRPGSTTLPSYLKASVGSVTKPHERYPGWKMSNKKKGLTSLPPPTSNPSAGSSSGTSTMNPTLGISQQAQSGIQSLGADNSSVSNPLSQQTSSALHPAQFEFVKVWEGNLYFSGRRQGPPVFITRLEGYICFSASVALAVNLPPTLQIVRVTPQELMYSRHFVRRVKYQIFKAMDQNDFFGMLQEKKLCAIIKLPSEILLLSVSDKLNCMVGMVCPLDLFLSAPQPTGGEQGQVTTEASASTDAATAAAGIQGLVLSEPQTGGEQGQVTTEASASTDAAAATTTRA
uniref:mediator of RNA polymerase II transcription subunit 25-like isoform X1 n=1 Tax=Fragaria vesca subsp. vesca TaxID=101020 RepID=UPI0005C8F006|nr:PREDICTED: mediator of RNA polymerase II transcription subunit 25-like isoform X1 [Fragaria vesca subsp. vesca]